MSLGVDGLEDMVPIVIPWAVMLLVVTVVGSLSGCPIYSSVVWYSMVRLHP